MDSVRCRTAERFPTRKQSFRFPGVSGTSTEKSILNGWQITSYIALFIYRTFPQFLQKFVRII